MKKAIVGIAAVLALTTTTSARDAKTMDKASSDSSSRVTAIKSKGAAEPASSSGTIRVARARTDSSSGTSSSRSKMNQIDPNSSHAERWLVEREGYRDGGY